MGNDNCLQKNPRSTVYGVSRLSLDENETIIEQRDYCDLWGDIFDNIQVLRNIYRLFMKKVFG